MRHPALRLQQGRKTSLSSEEPQPLAAGKDVKLLILNDLLFLFQTNNKIGMQREVFYLIIPPGKEHKMTKESVFSFSVLHRTTSVTS